MEKLLCRDICPLPEGCATDKISGTDDLATKRLFRLIRKIEKSGKVVGEIDITVEDENIGEKGAEVPEKAVVCESVKSFNHTVMNEREGSTDQGSVRCPYAKIYWGASEVYIAEE